MGVLIYSPSVSDHQNYISIGLNQTFSVINNVTYFGINNVTYFALVCSCQILSLLFFYNLSELLCLGGMETKGTHCSLSLQISMYIMTHLQKGEKKRLFTETNKK